MSRRFLSALLAVVMVLGLIVNVAAEGELPLKDDDFEYQEITETRTITKDDGTTESKEVTIGYSVIKYIGSKEDAVIPDRFNNKPVIAIGLKKDGQNPSYTKTDSVFASASTKLRGIVTIPNSVSTIYPYAFAESDVRGVDIPGTVKTIGQHAFEKCTTLTNVNILDSANETGNIILNHTTIEEHAFSGCTQIASLVIPNSVKIIGKYAFTGCSGLKDIVLPISVTDIDYGVFSGCENLKNIVLLGNNVNMKDNSFPWEPILNQEGGAFVHYAYNMTRKSVISQIMKALGVTDEKDLDARYKEMVHEVTEPSKTEKVSGWNEEEPCKAYGPGGTENSPSTITLSFSCNGFDQEIKETVTKSIEVPVLDEQGEPVVEDGKPKTEIKEVTEEVTKTVHKDCTAFMDKNGDRTTNKYNETRNVSAVYHHEEALDDKAATCISGGQTGGTRCTICEKNIEPPTPIPATGIHTFDENSETVREILFDALCDKDGLILITKKCSVCKTFAPVCSECEWYKLQVGAAEAKLEAAKKALEAEKAKEQPALVAYQKAKREADAAKDDYDKKLKAFEDAVQALNELKSSETATEDEIQEAENMMRELNGLQVDAYIVWEEKDGTAAQKESELEEIQSAIADAQWEIQSPGVSDARDRLSSHVLGRTSHFKCAECDGLIEEFRKAADEDAKADVQRRYDRHKQGSQIMHGRCQTCEDLAKELKTSEDTALANFKDHIIDNWWTCRNGCRICEELLRRIDTARAEFLDHWQDTSGPHDFADDSPVNFSKAISGEPILATGDHNWGPWQGELDRYSLTEEQKDIIECGKGGKLVLDKFRICQTCGEPGYPEGNEPKSIIVEAKPYHEPDAGWPLKETKPATCIADGEKIYEPYDCKYCGKHIEDGKKVLPKIGDGQHKRPANVEVDTEKTIPATCTEPGTNVYKAYTCTICFQEVEAGEEEETPALGHDLPEDVEDVTVKEATCTEKGEVVKGAKVCKREGCDHIEGGETEEIAPLGHDWDKTSEDYKEEVLEAATCLDDGKMKITGPCKREDNQVVTAEEAIKAIGQHNMEGQPDVITVAPTCTETGLKNTGMKKCTNPGCDYVEIGEENVVVPALGHDWGNFVPKNPEDMKQNDNCLEKDVEGTVSCTRKTDDYECEETKGAKITIPGKQAHTWGEWVIDKEKNIKTRTCKVCGKPDEQPLTVCTEHTWGDWEIVTPATATTEGLRKRVCKVCGEEETQKISALGEPPVDPNEPDPNADYTVTVSPTSNGTATVSTTTAKAGTGVVLTVAPSSGYELDMIRIIAGGVSVVNYTSQGGGKYGFTMPAANVTVTVSFSLIDTGSGWGGVSNGASGDPPRSKDNPTVQITPQSAPGTGAWTQMFFDVPTGHWAAGEINWASQMGYMNGAVGYFNPDTAVSAQQTWMVLARFMGANPTTMAEAQRWAVNSGFAAGGDPNGSLVKHQAVTALYRCAVLRGRATRPTGLNLAGYADSRLIPAAARDAMIWAISNGIVTPDENNRLSPVTTVSRAQFAVLLYRFSQRV